MRLTVLAGLLGVLLFGGVARAQDSVGPWQDCDYPQIGITVDTDALVPGLARGRRLTAICFTHAIRGSSLLAGQVRLSSLSPPIARGDLVAFRRPEDVSRTTIRRVIGLPGDRIQIRDYRVLINDTLLATDQMGEAQVTDAGGRPVTVVRLHETITPRIRGYDILVPRNSTDGSGTLPVFTVPGRSIYVLPDNRSVAANLSAPDAGIVPVVNLIARLTVRAEK